MKKEFTWAIAGFIIYILITRKAQAEPVKIPGGMNAVTQWHTYVASASERFAIPVERIFAHIKVESDGNPKALGTIGERGLMQMTPGALQDVNRVFKLGYTFDDMFNAEKNIIAGTAYLKILYSQLNSLDLASQAFNVGAGNVLKNKNSGIAYLKKIYNSQAQFV